MVNEVKHLKAIHRDFIEMFRGVYPEQGEGLNMTMKYKETSLTQYSTDKSCKSCQRLC